MIVQDVLFQNKPNTCVDFAKNKGTWCEGCIGYWTIPENQVYIYSLLSLFFYWQ